MNPEDVVNAADPKLWAAQGGILGLIILALFVVMVLLLWWQRKDRKEDRDELKDLLVKTNDLQVSTLTTIGTHTKAVEASTDVNKELKTELRSLSERVLEQIHEKK